MTAQDTQELAGWPETIKARTASVICDVGALCGWPAPDCKSREAAAALFDAGLLAASPSVEQSGRSSAEPVAARYAMSPGAADHFKGEALAAREALGFDPSSEEVSPSDLEEAIHAQRAALTEARTFLNCCRAEAKGVNENRYDYANSILAKVNAALSPPVGQQEAVAVKADIETQAWECDKWPAWLHGIVERTNEVADRLDMSTEQAIAYAVLSALSPSSTDLGGEVEKEPSK